MSDLNRPEFVCRAPFNNLELLPTGAVACCGAFFTEEFHRRAKTSGTDYQAHWNGSEYQELRQSMLDGSYRHCTDRCPEFIAIRNKTSEMCRENAGERVGHCLATGQTSLPMGPVNLALSNDMSCNLKCRSCRTGFIRDSREQHDRLFEKTVALLEQIGKDIVTLGFSSTGEPFFSRYYLRLMREYLCRKTMPKAYLHLGTNGTLLTPRMWESLKCCELAHFICVSVDAATPETYAITRGFDWARLMENLRFIQSLREANVFKHYQLRMVVQAVNWREMEAFFTLAKSFSADPVYQLVYPYGSLTDADMIYYPGHPDYAAFMAHLRAFDARHPNVESYYRQLL